MSFEFMDISQKAAYIQGLADGLELDKSTPEGKIIDAMLDLICEMTDEFEMLKEDVQALQEDSFDFDDDFDDDFDEDNPDYEVVCPDCGAEVVVDEDTLIEGEISCPNCGGTLEFDFSSLFDAEKDESEDLPF